MAGPSSITAGRGSSERTRTTAASQPSSLPTLSREASTSSSRTSICIRKKPRRSSTPSSSPMTWRRQLPRHAKPRFRASRSSNGTPARAYAHPRTRAPLKQRAPNPGEGRQHRPSPLLRPSILPLNGANPALRMGHMAHPKEPLARTVKAGNPWAVTDRGGHDHEKEGLCDSHPLHQSLCHSCSGGLRWQRRRYRQWWWRRSRKASRGYEDRLHLV